MTPVFLCLFYILELKWNCIKISVTPKLVKSVITNLDLPKAYGPDSIPVVVLRTAKSLIFMYSSWTIQYVCKGILFSRQLKGLIGGPGNYEGWERCMSKSYCPVKSSFYD